MTRHRWALVWKRLAKRLWKETEAYRRTINQYAETWEAALSERDAAHEEIERRTMWSDAQLHLRGQDAERWHTIADERSAEIVRLIADVETAVPLATVLTELDAHQAETRRLEARIAELEAKLETAQSNINALGESWRIPCERAEARIAELGSELSCVEEGAEQHRQAWLSSEARIAELEREGLKVAVSRDALLAERDAAFGALEKMVELKGWAIGDEFRLIDGGDVWRVTDVGSRVLVAIKVQGLCKVVHYKHGEPDSRVEIERPIEPRDLNGPPYAVEEVVFDEYDQRSMIKIEGKT